MYKLHSYPSNASFVPHVLLEELDVSYELVLVDRANSSQKSDAYLKLNPTGRIPVLEHGDRILHESAAISIYLCEVEDNRVLLPSLGDPRRPPFFQWLHYLTSTYQSELMVYFYPEKHTTDPKGSEAIRSAQARTLQETFKYLDSQLSDRFYLLGDQITICDYYVFMLSVWSEKLPSGPRNYPNLLRSLKKIVMQDSVARVCEKENIDTSPYIQGCASDLG